MGGPEGVEDPGRGVGGHGALREGARHLGEPQGILELPEDAPIGEALRDYYGDTIFELEVTPNRPDHMSMLGVAWEVAAQTHMKVREPERVYSEAGTQRRRQRTSVTIEAQATCVRVTWQASLSASRLAPRRIGCRSVCSPRGCARSTT